MDTPGVEIVGPMHVFGHDDAPHGHMHIRFNDVRVPKDNMLLGEGRGFEISQVRLGPGRIHHCMRSIGAAERAIELMVDRGLSREGFGKKLINLGKNMEVVSRARIEIEAMRLMVLRAAKAMDTLGNAEARVWVSAVKAMVPEKCCDIIDEAIQMHGAAGISQWFPLADMWHSQRTLRLADGPDEVHHHVVGRATSKAKFSSRTLRSWFHDGLIGRDGAVGVISIDDGKANALSPDVLSAIAEAFDKAEADGATAVLLQGRPGRFSAGFDLSIMTSGVEPMRALVTQGAELLLRIFTYPAPVVAACTGHAPPRALVLLVSDVRIGAEGEFKIGLNEVAIGMGLPIFAIEFARYRMPPSAFDSALLGEVFAEAAVRAGYLDRTSANVIDDAMAEAQRLSALRTGAVNHSKQHARKAIADQITSGLKADMSSSLRDLP